MIALQKLNRFKMEMRKICAFSVVLYAEMGFYSDQTNFRMKHSRKMLSGEIAIATPGRKKMVISVFA